MLKDAAMKQELKANQIYVDLFQAAGVRADRVPTFCDDLEEHQGLLLHHELTGYAVFHRCRGAWWRRAANEEIAERLRSGSPSNVNALIMLFTGAGVAGLQPQPLFKISRFKPVNDVLALGQAMQVAAD